MQDYKTPKPARKAPTASIKWNPEEDQKLREVGPTGIGREGRRKAGRQAGKRGPAARLTPSLSLLLRGPMDLPACVQIVAVHGARNWKKVAELLGVVRTDVQCQHRWNKASGGRQAASE